VPSSSTWFTTAASNPTSISALKPGRIAFAYPKTAPAHPETRSVHPTFRKLAAQKAEDSRECPRFVSLWEAFNLSG
jgi:hypothetical protein